MEASTKSLADGELRPKYGIELVSPLLDYLDSMQAKMGDTGSKELEAAAVEKEEHAESTEAKPRRIQPAWVGPNSSISMPDISLPVKPVPAVATHQLGRISRLNRSIEEDIAYKKEKAMRRKEWRSRNAAQREEKAKEEKANKRKEKNKRAKERKAQLKSLAAESRDGSDGKGEKFKGKESLAPPTTSENIVTSEKDVQAREKTLIERGKILQAREVALKAREAVLRAREDAQVKESVRIYQEAIFLGHKYQGR